MASTTARPLGDDPNGWVGRRVIIQQPGGREQRGLVESVRVGDDGQLHSVTVQPPSGASIYVPSGSIDGVQADGWAEALSQANDDFHLGQ